MGPETEEIRNWKPWKPWETYRFNGQVFIIQFDNPFGTGRGYAKMDSFRT